MILVHHFASMLLIRFPGDPSQLMGSADHGAVGRCADQIRLSPSPVEKHRRESDALGRRLCRFFVSGNNLEQIQRFKRYLKNLGSA
ncbi:unnamed protein product [Victoria cruziana]